MDCNALIDTCMCPLLPVTQKSRTSQPEPPIHLGLMHMLNSRIPWLQVPETPEMYDAIVKPYIDSIPASRIQWVYNILEKKVVNPP